MIDEVVDLNRYYSDDDPYEKDYTSLYNSWYDLARNADLDTLMTLIRRLTTGYKHTYESYVHAVTACAIAAATAAGEEMSGAQAGFVSVLFPKEFFYWNNKCGISLRDWDNMLFPQYERGFNKVMSASTWKALQEEAKRLYEEDDELASHEVRAHWKSIIDGKVPFGYEVANDKS